MPRPRLHAGAPPDLDALYGLAEAQVGYFDVRQARECGFSGPLLHHHVRANRFEHVARGIYRLVKFPPGDHEDLVVAWLWSAREGTFSHETALALHDLSDALPSTKHLTLPIAWKRRRVQVPSGVLVHFADLPAEALAWRGPIPVTTPLRTLIDCIRDQADPTLVSQAIAQALERGVLVRARLETEIRALGFDPRTLLPRPARR